MCAVDQKRPFFPRAGPFLAFLPFKEVYENAGPLREAPYGEGRSLREGPGRGALRSQRRTTKRLTGRLSPYGKPLIRGGTVLTGRAGPYGKGRGALRVPSQRRTTKRLTALTRRENPLRGRTLTGKEGPEGQGLLQPFPELGGNFRLCAVDQKKPFFPRAGPFLAFLPFMEAYGKAGPLREAPYGEGRSLQEGPVLTGESLTGMAPFTKKGRLMGSYGERFYQNWAGNFRLCAVDQKKPFFPRAGPFLAFLPFKEAYEKAGPFLQGGTVLTPSLREGPVLTERAGVPYGSLHKEGRRRGLRPLREGKIPYREEPLRERKVLKARDSCSHSQNWAGISACVP